MGDLGVTTVQILEDKIFQLGLQRRGAQSSPFTVQLCEGELGGGLPLLQWGFRSIITGIILKSQIHIDEF